MKSASKNIVEDDLIRKITEDSLMSIANDEQTSADVLQELAESDLSSTTVREAIASNVSCSDETNLFLCDDDDREVRIALCKKAAQICETRGAKSKCINKEKALSFLRKLAADTEISVRETLAEEIKECEHIPAEIAQTLARDVAESVAMPVLEYSPLLEDKDLLEIISTNPKKTGVLCAISRRSAVSEIVSDSLIDTQNQEVIPSLLKNANAQIREDALNRIVEGAKNNQTWQEALMTRPKLPSAVFKRIEKFISVELINHLYSKGHVDVDGAKQLMGRVKKRLSKPTHSPHQKQPPAKKQPQSDNHFADKLPEDEKFLVQSIEKGNHEAVYTELAHRAELKAAFIRRAIISKNAKVITALCWKSGLSAGLAYLVQKKVVGLKQDNCVLPLNDNEYSLSEKEMSWHLEVFGANRACNIM